jgi:hypothetical protein
MARPVARVTDALGRRVREGWKEGQALGIVTTLTVEALDTVVGLRSQ